MKSLKNHAWKVTNVVMYYDIRNDKHNFVYIQLKNIYNYSYFNFDKKKQ